jgi:uncharacterized protein (TIGR03437 family)
MLLILLALLLCVPGLAQKVGATARQQDLNFVANQLPALNPNLFFQLDRAQFQQALADLNAKVSGTTDGEFYTGLAQVVAMAGDAHTVIDLLDDYAFAVGFQTLPIALVWLDDGVFATAALTPYARAAGTRLIGVGGMPIDQVVQALGTVISHENDQWVHYRSQQYLTAMQVLQGLHVAPAGGSVPMTFRTLAGEEFTLQIAPGNGVMATAPDAQTGPIADYLRFTDLNYWYRYSPENRLLYFKYNRCDDDPAHPFAVFAAQVLATLDTNAVDTFVWDFRGNTGGNTSVIQPLGLGLNSRIQSLLRNPRFRIYLAMDKGTFSAAVSNAMSFTQPLPGISQVLRVIGEATGGKPAYFGNVQGVNLPGSKLLLQYSTARIALPAWVPDGPSFQPQIAVHDRSTDYFARHDAVLAAILARTDALPAAPSGNAVMVNGASYRSDQGVAPGSFARVFGAFASVPDQVLVGSAEAKIIGGTASQVNVVVPAVAQTGIATVSVRTGGAELASGQVTITQAGAGIFVLNPADGAQPGAVENQDYSVNSAGNPARAGSVVQIFATGDGIAAVQVFIGGLPASVMFSGPIAQFPGLWQMNAQVPEGIAGQVPVFVIAGNLASNAATIYVK